MDPCIDASTFDGTRVARVAVRAARTLCIHVMLLDLGSLNQNHMVNHIYQNAPDGSEHPVVRRGPREVPGPGLQDEMRHSLSYISASRMIAEAAV